MKTSFRSPLAVVLVVAIIAALAISAAFAAPGGNGQKPGAGVGFVERFAQELNLTDAQKAQIQAIVQEHRAEAQKVRQSNLTAEQKKAKLEELRKDMQTKIDAVLTAEQRAKLNEMRENRQEKREELGECFKSLNLTDDQKTKIQAIRTETRPLVQAVRRDTTLNQQQKTQKIAQIRKDAMKKVLDVLTPEQREKLKECQKANKVGRGQ